MNKYFVESDEMVDKALEILAPESLLSLDTETGGLNAHTAPLWSVQLGSRNESFLFPYNALNEASRAKLRIALAEKECIAHNAVFDAKFLQANGFQLPKFYCTQEVERTMYAGKYFTYGLKDLMHRRFQIKMDKEAREDFYDGTFAQRNEELGPWDAWTEELIEYALTDIEYLHEIYDQQVQESAELGMTNVHWLENNVVPVNARMQNRGVYLDEKATKKFEDIVTLRRDEISVAVFGHLEKSYNISLQKQTAERLKLWDTWQAKHDEIVAQSKLMKDPLDKRKKTDEAKDMVAESNKKKPFAKRPDKMEKPFNPKSPAMLCMALTHATGTPITTTNKDWLEENTHIHEVIADLVEFRKFEKLVQFCELPKFICDTCGRIHANFHQNGTRSGRWSCSDPNLQQIPARSAEAKEFRALFRVAKKNRKLVGADLAGIELVILAYFGKEPDLLEAINSGKDVHCYTMSQFLNCSYDSLIAAKEGNELTEEEDKELTSARVRFESSFVLPDLNKIKDHTGWVKKLRDYTKTLTYGLVYGLSAWGLSRKFHCEYDYAEMFIQMFFRIYPNLKRYLTTLEELGFEQGYAVNMLGRRRWFSKPYMKKYPDIEAAVMKAFDKEGRLWESIEDSEWNAAMAKAVDEAKREYRSKVNSIKRQSGNFTPQSLCAEMVKLAMYLFDKDFRGNDDEGLILTVHDELIAEVNKKNVKHAEEVMQNSLVKAVNKFMPDITVNVDVKVMDVWEK